MGIDKQTAIEHLNSVLETYSLRCKDDGFGMRIEEPALVRTRLRNAIKRLAPPDSEYFEALNGENLVGDAEIHHFAGVATALRSDYQGGYLNSFRELINSDLLDDFLAMATYLLQDERLKQPAAVLAGSVLEEHLRKMCRKHGVDLTYKDGKGVDKPKMGQRMNDDLRVKGVYGGNDQKQVTAWCGIRNSAAHGNHNEYDDSQVALMVDGIRNFISRFPA